MHMHYMNKKIEMVWINFLDKITLYRFTRNISIMHLLYITMVYDILHDIVMSRKTSCNYI
jgi:hypothetical protein